MLKDKVKNLEKEKELMQRELDLKDKLIEIEQHQANVYKEAFEKEKELTDRALKLADQAEKKNKWQTIGIIGSIVAIIVLVSVL